MHPWLDQARIRLAEAVGDDASIYELSQGDVDQLLDLARVAAHESEERTNAPLLSYLVGVAHARHRDRDLAALVAGVVGKE